jgi:hypothetical protein
MPVTTPTMAELRRARERAEQEHAEDHAVREGRDAEHLVDDAPRHDDRDERDGDLHEAPTWP